MTGKITFITCTVCTLGLSGSVGGLIHALNDLDEDSLLIKETKNLKDKKQKLENKIKENKNSNNEENEKISKEIKFLKEKLTAKINSLVYEIKELAGKILNVFLKAIEESKESEEYKKYKEFKNVEDLINKINEMEVYHNLGESVKSGSEIEKEKKYYNEEIKSKIFEDTEARKIYEQIVKKAFV